jgi:hypothetical protein
MMPKTESSQLAPPPEITKKAMTHPSEWSVEEVVEWLKSKGFDESVCDKFVGE